MAEEQCLNWGRRQEACESLEISAILSCLCISLGGGYGASDLNVLKGATFINAQKIHKHLGPDSQGQEKWRAWRSLLFWKDVILHSGTQSPLFSLWTAWIGLGMSPGSLELPSKAHKANLSHLKESGSLRWPSYIGLVNFMTSDSSWFHRIDIFTSQRQSLSERCEFHCSRVHESPSPLNFTHLFICVNFFQLLPSALLIYESYCRFFTPSMWLFLVRRAFSAHLLSVNFDEYFPSVPWLVDSLSLITDFLAADFDVLTFYQTLSLVCSFNI